MPPADPGLGALHGLSEETSPTFPELDALRVNPASFHRGEAVRECLVVLSKILALNGRRSGAVPRLTPIRDAAIPTPQPAAASTPSFHRRRS